MCIISPLTVIAQHQDLQEKPKIWLSEPKIMSDTTSLLSAFKNGTVNGHFRYFYSLTNNRTGLTDYFANAVGGGIRYETRPYYGWSVGVSGFYIFNAGSSKLLTKDPATSQSNRYEIGLFDVAETIQIHEINRVEEFHIKYQSKGLKVIAGRQLLNTPFINLQDGRMRPSAVEGIWIEENISPKSTLQLGWIYAIAPRSTSKWYSMADAIGIYSAGVDAQGARSSYFGNVQCKGAFMFNYQWKASHHLKINLWDIYLDNILNTGLLQADLELPLPQGRLYFGLQNALQVKVGKGGNADASLAYYTNTQPVWILGLSVGWKNTKWDHSFNFNSINKGGRYLMPREFGRDYFYTFMPRERNEGLGGVTAFTWKSVYKFNQATNIQPSFGYYSLPDVKNYYLNKYGLPSYCQLNIDIRHKFGAWLQGLEAQLLYVHKWKIGEDYGNERYVIHKVDMDLLNFVVNFRF